MNGSMAEMRQRVYAEAKRWIGTPFMNHQCVLGAGVDCVSMPAAVYNAAIGTTIIPGNWVKSVNGGKDYSPQWFMHAGADGEIRELYMEGLVANGFVEVSDRQPGFEPFDASAWIEADKGMGDMAVTRIGRAFAHGAIIGNWPTIVQAEPSPNGRGEVVSCNAEVSWFFSNREVRYFSRKEWHV